MALLHHDAAHNNAGLRREIRPQPVMPREEKTMAGKLMNEDLPDVAAYYASLKKK